MFPTLNNGLAGLSANQQALDVASSRIAQAGMSQANLNTGAPSAPPSTVVSLSGATPPDYATETVNSIAAKNGFMASARVIKVADEMLDTMVNLQSK